MMRELSYRIVVMWIFLSIFGLVFAQSRPTVQAPPKLLLVENQSSYRIINFYISSSSNEKWGRDLLGLVSIPPGSSFYIDVSGQSTDCINDLMLEFATKEKITKYKVDLCKKSVTWRIGVIGNSIENK
jgi:hypothetical protein